MANETTSTTLTEIINSEWIRPAFQDYSHDFVVATQFLLNLGDLGGKGSLTVAVPRIQSDLGTVNAAGTGVDTEYDATEGTDLSNTQMDLLESTITVSEYGIMRTVTDKALKAAVSGFDMVQQIVMDAARVLHTALEFDVCALFPGFSNGQSSTGVNISLANFKAGIVAIRNRGVRAPGGLVFVGSMSHGSDLEDALSATSTDTYATYPEVAAAQLRATPEANNGLTNGHICNIRGVPVYATGLCSEANTAADDVGAIFVRGDIAANAPFAALGRVDFEGFKAQTDPDISLRAQEVVSTLLVGVGELQDDAGESMTFDA